MAAMGARNVFLKIAELLSLCNFPPLGKIGFEPLSCSGLFKLFKTYRTYEVVVVATMDNVDESDKCCGPSRPVISKVMHKGHAISSGTEEHL